MARNSRECCPPGQLKGKLNVPTIVIESNKYAPITFNNAEELEEYLDDPENRSELRIGQVFHVLDDATPDYWWNGRNLSVFKTETRGVTIEYVDEELPSPENANSSKLYIIRKTGDMYRWDVALGDFVRVGSSTSGYVHVQRKSSALWEICHHMNKFPSVTVVDSAGTVVVGEVRYEGRNKLVVEFSHVFSGKAYLN